MQEQVKAVEDLLSKTTDYLEARVELLELKAIGKTAKVTSSFVSGLVIGILLSLVLLFTHLGIAVWLGAILGQLYYGFFCIAAFYVAIAVILFFYRKKLLELPVTNAIIKNLSK
jgi:tetrahydromethanopterin S-methyltransferase subunit F